MKKLILLSFFLSLSFFGGAQILDNNINLYLGYFVSSFKGEKIIKEGDFSLPSLFNNYKVIKGVSVKGMVKMNNFFSLGLGVNYYNAKRWENQFYSDYRNSKTDLCTISIPLRLQTAYKKQGLANRIKLFIEVAPQVGISSLHLNKNRIFSVQRYFSPYPVSMNRNDIFIGVNESTGIDVAISNYFDMFLSYSLEQNKINPKYFNDKHFSGSSLEFGIIVKFKKDKYYSH